MNDSVLVRVLERGRHLARNADRFVDRQLVFAAEAVAETLAVHVHHREPELAGGRLAGIEDREDVRVLEARGDADLAAESLRAEAGRKLRVQDLDGDWATVLRILGTIDGRHAAATDLLFQRVLRSDRSLEPVQRVR